MLIEAINYLQERIEYTMKNIKLLCPNKLAFETISWMLEILKAMVKIKRDLGIWEETQQSEEELIRCLVRVSNKDLINFNSILSFKLAIKKRM